MFKNCTIMTLDLCAFSALLDKLTRLSEMPLVNEGSEEVGDFRSVSDWLTSGTNSFYNNDEKQTIS